MASRSPRRALFAGASAPRPPRVPRDTRAWRMSTHTDQRRNTNTRDLSASPLSYDNHSLHGDSFDSLHDKVSDEYERVTDFNADAESCSSSLQGLNFDSDSEYHSNNMDSPSMTKFQIIKDNFKSPSQNRLKYNSPSAIMKTPLDGALHTCMSPPKIPNRRQSLVREESAHSPRDNGSRKRPYENVDSTDCSRSKQFKSDMPKVRLSLFNTDNDTKNIPVKSFYDNSRESAKVASLTENNLNIVKQHKNLHSKRHRDVRKRKRSGEINFGVRHGIRKPKINKRKLSLQKDNTLNMALELIKNSPLNSYIEEFMKNKKLPESSTTVDTIPSNLNSRDLSNEQLNKMDAILKQLGNKNILSELCNAKPSLDDLESDSIVDLQLPKNNKFFKTSEQRNRVVKLPSMKIHIKNGKLCLPKRKSKHSEMTIANDSESMLQDDITILLDDGNEICDTSEKMTVENLLKQWGDDDDESGADYKSMHSEALKNIEGAQLLLQHSNETHNANEVEADFEEPNLQFIPVDDGYILMEEDDIDDDSTVPGDLDAIESELAKLDKKIMELAKLNNINPEIFISESSTEIVSADSDSFLNDTAPQSDEMENFIYDENLENDVNQCNTNRSPKLFPLFNKDAKYSNNNPKKANIDKPSPINKKFHSTAKDQYIIDAGQKKIGATECKECGVIYQIGDALDEADHLTYHNASDVLKFNGWKSERFCGRWGEGRAIVVLPGDPPSHWQRVHSLLEHVVHPQLGYAAALNPDKKYKVYLYISKKKIVGCLVAEMLDTANKIVTVNGIDCCSEEVYPVKCGVSRIWTHKSHRRKGIATQLINTMRVNFIFGHIMTCDEIAFSSPTSLGKAFAEKYTGKCDFNIYM